MIVLLTVITGIKMKRVLLVSLFVFSSNLFAVQDCTNLPKMLLLHLKHPLING